MQTVRPPAARGLSSHLLLANDYWIANNGPENAPSENNNWDGAAYYTGNQRLIEVLSGSIPAEATKRTSYLNRALAWSIGHDWEHGPKGPLDPDSHTCGQTYIDLYRLDPQPVRLAGVDDETAGDHVRFDDFEIRALLPPATGAPRITSINAVGGGVWELTLEGDAGTDYQFYSSADLTFNPGTLIDSLTQANPSEDAGTVTSGDLLTTDANGDGKVRLILGGATRDFVRAESAP